MHDATYRTELSISNLGNGYRDILARIDLDSYRRTHSAPHLPFFLVTFLDPDTNEGLCACPRATLQRVCAELEKEGYEAFAGAEVRSLPSPLPFIASHAYTRTPRRSRPHAVRVLQLCRDARVAARQGFQQPQGHD